MTANITGRRDNTIIVGVDFGTTFSGVAWARAQRPDRIRVMNEWKNHAGKLVTSSKVSTKLRYTDDGNLEWGFQISPEAPHDEVLEHFKLGLDPGHVETVYGESKVTKGNLLGQDIDKLVTDYLKSLGTGIIRILRQELGKSLDACDIQYVITVPAIWGDHAKQRTVDAFERAMSIKTRNSVIAISEPEAAATYVIQNLSKQILDKDDCFIVVDAGGGTVDLISYQIKGFHPSLEVSEAAQGSGGACGSAFLNERFKGIMTRTLGNEDGFDEDVAQQCLEKWERFAKRRFSMADLAAQENYIFPVVGLTNNKSINVRQSKWFLSASEVFRIFDGIVLQVLKLVTDQRVATKVPIKAVLLVGGFGQSTYLQERLAAHMGADIPVLQTENAWTAVVKGAVLKGLAQVSPEKAAVMKVVDRKARKHYGFELAVPYTQHEHTALASKRRWDSYNAQWEVDVMQWFIKRGDPVTESQPYTKDFVVVSRVSWGRPNLVCLNVFSDKTSDTAPLAKNHNVNTLCIVEADLSHIPDKDIPRRQGVDGMMYYVVECQVEIRYDSASTAYTLVHNGRKYNSVTAELV